jgi:hypothetical protein
MLIMKNKTDNQKINTSLILLDFPENNDQS